MRVFFGAIYKARQKGFTNQIVGRTFFNQRFQIIGVLLHPTEKIVEDVAALIVPAVHRWADMKAEQKGRHKQRMGIGMKRPRDR